MWSYASYILWLEDRASVTQEGDHTFQGEWLSAEFSCERIAIFKNIYEQSGGAHEGWFFLKLCVIEWFTRCTRTVVNPPVSTVVILEQTCDKHNVIVQTQPLWITPIPWGKWLVLVSSATRCTFRETPPNHYVAGLHCTEARGQGKMDSVGFELFHWHPQTTWQTTFIFLWVV